MAKPKAPPPVALKPKRSTPSRLAGHARLEKLPAPKSITMAGAAQVSADQPLTAQQLKFCQFRAEGDNIANSLARAGYSTKDVSYGSRLSVMPNVKREIARLQAEYQKAAEVSKRDVMDMLKESYEMAKLMAEPATMVSAAREIGKMCGYYEPKKVQVDVSVSGNVKFEQISDTELFAMIEKAAREAEMAEQALLEASQDPE